MPIVNFFKHRPRCLRRLLFWRRPDQSSSSQDAQAADRELVFSLSPSRIPSTKQLRYLPRLINPRESAVVRWLSGLAVLSILVLGGHWFSRHFVWAPIKGGTLAVGLVGTPQYINPVLAQPFSVDADLSRLAFRGLMRVDDKMQLTTDLAESVDLSADGKTYTIKLPIDQKWSDGQPLTADDVRFTLETAADVNYQSPTQSLFQNITLTVIDDRTLTIGLSQPLTSFLSYLTIGLIPYHAWSDATPQTVRLAELNLKPIGNGPYKFQSVTKDRTGNIKAYSFTRNRYYTGTPTLLDRIEVKFYADSFSALDALQQNSIDSLGGIAQADVATVTKHHQLTHFSLAQLTAVFFSQKTNPALRTKDVRQALSMATNKPSIIDEILGGVGQVIEGPLLPGQPAYNPNLRRYDFDLAAAGNLLDQAGWKMNAQGIRQKGAQQLTFTLTTVDDPVYRAVANNLITNWKSIGANVELKVIEANRIQKDIIRPRNYEALIFGELYEADADPYPLWHSSQIRDGGYNLAVTYLKNADRDLEDARQTTNPEQRLKDLFDFQNIIADEVPAIFLYQTQYLFAHIKSLRGFSTQTLVTSTDLYSTISSWYLKTRLRWK